MSAREMLQRAVDLSDEHASRMAAALGWPDVEQMRGGSAFSTSDYNEYAHFRCTEEERPLFEPFAAYHPRANVMIMTDRGRGMVALRLLAEGHD